MQRHTGEDTTGEDTTGVIGSGNCIKLPLKLENAAGQIKTNTLVTGNGKEEPAANNNIKEENNSVSGRINFFSILKLLTKISFFFHDR